MAGKAPLCSLRLAASMKLSDTDDEGVVRQTIHSVLSRDATKEEIERGAKLMNELQAEYSITRERAVELFCLSVLNWNEFLFLD